LETQPVGGTGVLARGPHAGGLVVVDELSGNMAAVARALGVHRATVMRFVDKRPKLLEAALDLRETMKDNAESSLYNAVLAGEPWAVRFFLTTQAKDRGYVERQEMDLRGEVRQRVIEEVIDTGTSA
jgi:hypothetical protein